MNEPVVTSAVAAVIALVVSPPPAATNFVPGWQPLGTEDSQGEDQNDK